MKREKTEKGFQKKNEKKMGITPKKAAPDISQASGYGHILNPIMIAVAPVFCKDLIVDINYQKDR